MKTYSYTTAKSVYPSCKELNELGAQGFKVIEAEIFHNAAGGLTVNALMEKEHQEVKTIEVQEVKTEEKKKKK